METEEKTTQDPTAAPTHEVDADALKSKVIDMLKSCYDPEIPVNIFELGLIYEVRAEKNGDVYVRMTLTSPHCPVAESLPREVEDKIRGIDEAENVKVEITWEPPWQKDMMSEAAKLQLN